MILEAPFAPIPLAFDMAFTSSDMTANLSSFTVSVDRRDMATFGPTPLTPSSILNTLSSSAFSKPNRLISSSCIYMYVLTFISECTGGSFSINFPDTMS